MWDLMNTWSVTTEYVINPERVADEQNASVGSAWSIHSDLGWHQDTERGQKWALCWWRNLLAVSKEKEKQYYIIISNVQQMFEVHFA